MIVVSDTSPLNYLVLVRQEHILPTLFARVVAPPAVVDEMLHAAAPEPVRAWAAAPPAWLEVIAPNSVDATLALGEGEQEAISIAQELGADIILIDERKASAVASRLGLAVTGTMGVLDLAAERGLIDLPSVIAALRNTSFRCSDQIIDKALSRDDQRRSRGKTKKHRGKKK